MYKKPELKKRCVDSIESAAIAARSGMGCCKITYVEK